ncbi:phosphatase domain-containing protein [Blastococcus sp. Marseille-P5729]|uniref:phosphatase domain-containing protein n=1 Tax=Blastococcus sp. Marseille-P5729 TaxID=2086582 RepID=UPI000D0F2719|nr:phosphatase domain-containing protein [Blastococcus sp. Marseille-P5729]
MSSTGDRNSATPSVAAAVGELLDSRIGAPGQQSLVALLAELSFEDLNAVLEHIDTAELFDSVDDRIAGPGHRTALIELLSRTRVHELSLKSAAAVIYGMQRGHTPVDMERAIRDILRTRTGADLTRLKNLIGDRTDRHDLEGLVYYDIDDETVRAEILAHFHAHQPTGLNDEIKVLCDIDDTVFAKLHDDRYPRGVIYPGVLALLEALDHGPHDAPFSTGDLTFITARPADAFGLIETHARRTLRHAGIADLDLLGGTFGALLSKKAMAKRKLHNIEHYCVMFPEYRVMFIGDSGQGDPLVGEWIWDRHDDVAAVLIHDVVHTGEAERASKSERGLHYFDTYVGAAVVARDRELISDRGLWSVIDESRSALNEITWADAAQRAEIERLVERDIALAAAKYPLTGEA